MLLLIALQALTLLEFVAQRELAERKEALAGLVPGNPKMKTTRYYLPLPLVVSRQDDRLSNTVQANPQSETNHVALHPE